MQPYVPGGSMNMNYLRPHMRMAGAAPAAMPDSSWLKGLGARVGGMVPKGLGGALGAAAIGAPVVMEVLGQVGREDVPGDPQSNLARNAGGSVGALGGGVAGAVLGGLLGGGPIGAGIGAWALGSLGGGAGRGLAGNVFDASRGTPEDRATQQAIRNARAMARSQMGLAEEGMPLQIQQMELAQQMERQRFNDLVLARARDTYQQSLLGAMPPVGAYADPGFMQALGMASRIG